MPSTRTLAGAVCLLACTAGFARGTTQDPLSRTEPEEAEASRWSISRQSRGRWYYRQKINAFVYQAIIE